MLLLVKHSEATRVRILWDCLLTSQGFTSFSRRVVKCFPRFLFLRSQGEIYKIQSEANWKQSKTHFDWRLVMLWGPHDDSGMLEMLFKNPFSGWHAFFIAPFHIVTNLFHQIRRFWKSLPWNIQKRSVIKSLKMILENLTTFIMCKHFQLIQISGMKWIRRFLLIPLKSFASENAASSKWCGCFRRTGSLKSKSSLRKLKTNRKLFHPKTTFRSNKVASSNRKFSS